MNDTSLSLLRGAPERYLSATSMRPRSIIPALAKLALPVLLWCAVVPALAQDRAALDRLSTELCGCMVGIDPRSADAVLDARVKRCLEDAVVLHPGTVSALLERDRQEGDRAFKLGRTLGTLLERDCPGFQVIKARLQQMTPPATARRRATM